MFRKTATIVLVTIAITGSVFFAWQIPAKKKYDGLKEKRLQAPVFAVHPIDAETEAFLENARSSWKAQSDETPDPIFAEIASVIGGESTVEGVVSFYTHELPEFSFFDRSRNAEATLMAEALLMALPISLDGRIYVKDRLAFTKLNENGIEVFEDTERGLRRALYIKPKPASEAPESSDEG